MTSTSSGQISSWRRLYSSSAPGRISKVKQKRSIGTSLSSLAGTASGTVTDMTRGEGGQGSMTEVADAAGVAMSSVSRVLSGHPDVSDEMRARVMLAVEKLGYTPDMLAQSLRRRATLSIGFVAGDISNPLMASIVKGAETELRRGEYSMLLANSEGDPDRDAEHIRLFGQRRVDGLMLS